MDPPRFAALRAALPDPKIVRIQTDIADVQPRMSVSEFTLTLAVRVAFLMVLLGVVGGMSYGATHWEPRVEAGTSESRNFQDP